MNSFWDGHDAEIQRLHGEISKEHERVVRLEREAKEERIKLEMADRVGHNVTVKMLEQQARIAQLEAAATEVLRVYMPQFNDSRAVDDCLVGLAAAVANIEPSQSDQAASGVADRVKA
jgi:hypothetical protein